MVSNTLTPSVFHLQMITGDAEETTLAIGNPSSVLPLLSSDLYAPTHKGKGKGSPYSITEHKVTELILVLRSQPAGDVSHKPGGRLPLLSARPAVTPATLKRAATNFAAW